MFYLIRNLYCTEEIIFKSLKPDNAQYFKSHYYALWTLFKISSLLIARNRTYINISTVRLKNYCFTSNLNEDSKLTVNLVAAGA